MNELLLFGIVIGISLTVYCGALILLYFEKLKNKKYERERAENSVRIIQEKEKQNKFEIAYNNFLEERNKLFSKYGIPDLELCLNNDSILYSTNVQDYIYVFKSSDCIYALGKTFRCGDFLSVELVDTQIVNIGGRFQFENTFRAFNILNHHLIGDLLVDNETKEYINITEKTNEIAKERGLQYYTISHKSYLEFNPIYVHTNGIPFKFRTPIMYGDEQRLNGLIKFFTIATDYSIHLSKERILLLTFLEGFSDENIYELDAFCVKTHIYIDSDELQRDLIRHAVEVKALSNFDSDYEISHITEARIKALNYLNELQNKGQRLITFNDFEYKNKFDDLIQGMPNSPIVIVDGTKEPPQPPVETIKIHYSISESFRNLI